ncbi:UDP-2,3-diacylglucosamine diphosphatase [Frateuria aurantia]
MTTLFIADLHLDDARPEITELFERYLASPEVRQAEALYILGDLVEAWVGDDDDAALPTRIADALKAVRDAGVPVYFMPGNRDFLVGADYATRAGIERLDDITVHTLYGQPTLLMHGDLLCTDDAAYQALRRQLRNPQWQAQVLGLPLPIRRGMAAKAREESRQHTGSAREAIMDVNQTAVEDAMRQAGVHHLIHGHTHRPAVHHFDIDGQPASRTVLGDWYEQGSVLKLDADGARLEGLPLR